MNAITRQVGTPQRRRKVPDLPYYAELARAAGFEIVEQDAQAQHFYLRLRKP